MARRIRSKVITNRDQQVLVDLRVEYEMLGFQTSIEPGALTVYSTKKKKKTKKEKEKQERDKRKEKYERRS